jgi:hypothetical protein
MCCNNDDDWWDCPTCLQPMPPEHDRVCKCCDRRVSHHISVDSLCGAIREWQRRAYIAERESEEQARLLGMSAEREAKLLAEIQRLREQVLRAEAWPFDPNPFISADHDNDHKYP